MIEIISRLPAGYQEVEYIESTGTQYIDTGVVAASGFEVEIKIAITSYSAGMSGEWGTWAPLLGAHELSDPYKRNFVACKSDGSIEVDAGNKITTTAVSFSGNGIIKASNVANNYYLNVNGTNYTPTLVNDDSAPAYSSRTLHLLHCNGYDFGYTAGRLYYCKIYTGGNLVRDYVPCYRKADSTIGMYDLVNGVFYTNAGSGVFTKGADVDRGISVTPGGIIPQKYALRRRMISGITEPDENTLLLLHGEDFTDSSIYKQSITNNGVTVSATQSKFGGSSFYFNGSSYLNIPLPLNGDVTVEFWGYLTGYPTSWPSPINYTSGSMRGIYIHWMPDITYLCASSSSVNYNEASTGTISANIWHHFAIIRKGTTTNFYIDGVLKGTLDGTLTTNDILYIGTLLEASTVCYFQGYIDEFRVSNVARWTENFTPPTKPYNNLKI